MQSNKSLAIWASQTYSQGSGENNWSQYQLSLTGSSYKFLLNSAGTTSTAFSYYANYNGVDIANGDTILLSTNGSSFTSGTAGVVTTTPGTYTTPSISTSQTTSVSMSVGPITYITPDGLTLYTNTFAGGTTGYIYQYTLGTAFSFATVTYTGKSWTMPITTGSYGFGFTFKPDGTVLYITKNTTIYSYTLGTAWDISTAANNPSGTVTLARPLTTGNWTGNNTWGGIRFSPDGTKLILQSANVADSSNSNGDNFAIFTLSVPWVLGSAASTTTNYTNGTYRYGGYCYNQGFMFSPDGYMLIWVSSYYGSPTCNTSAFRYGIAVMSSPYNLTTITSSGWTSSWNPTGQQSPITAAWFVNNTGTLLSHNSTNLGYRATSQAVDYFAKNSVNITGFGLGAAPTYGYAPAPTVKVDAQTTAARVNLFDYQVYMASSTTSQAVVYKPAAGYIATGDTLSLNGSTTVTTSAVTEGSTGGVAAVPIYTAANRTYANKSYEFPASTSGTACVRFSADGSQVFALLVAGMPYGIGIYQFNLSTPWDISTATFGNMVLPMTLSNGSYGSFDFSADGLRLITWGMYLTGSSAVATTSFGYVYDHTLAQAFNIGTATYVGAFATNVDVGSNYTTSVRFIPNGQQLLFVRNNGTTFYIQYSALGTAYRVQTSGSLSTWFSAANALNDALLTPDGLNIITIGGISTSNTLGTAYNMATATTTNNPSTATSKWAWPSGTLASTAYANIGNLSPDGTKLYLNSAYTNTSVTWQFNVMVIPQTSYTCTFPTQGSAPTSVVVPDRSTSQTITTTLSGGNMTFAASTVATNARGIAMKITSPRAYTTITNATLSMWKS